MDENGNSVLNKVKKTRKGYGGIVMKKFITLLLALSMTIACFSFTACGKKDNKMKVGLLCLHDDQSTYDKNFIDAFNAACKAKGVKGIIKTDIPENSAECEEAAEDLVDSGCKIVFADSFGHENNVLSVARKHSDVQFCHATGTQAKGANLPNFHNAFASIYEGRFLAGVAAGCKLLAMYEANPGIAKNGVITVGYVGAYDYAEVKSGYTSWLLGIRSVFKDANNGITVNMIVKFTDSWYDQDDEESAATALIDEGCVLISQHADSWGAPMACENLDIPNVSYNGSTESRCPKTFIVSSRINWQPYFEYVIECVQKGNTKEMESDWVGTIASNSVILTPLGKRASVAGTQDVIDTYRNALLNGTKKVFDTSLFTVSSYEGGAYAELTNVMMDENKKLVSAKQNGVEVVKTANGITYFDESVNRSAPYFDINIDGIRLIAASPKKA